MDFFYLDSSNLNNLISSSPQNFFKFFSEFLISFFGSETTFSNYLSNIIQITGDLSSYTKELSQIIGEKIKNKVLSKLNGLNIELKNEEKTKNEKIFYDFLQTEESKNINDFEEIIIDELNLNQRDKKIFYDVLDKCKMKKIFEEIMRRREKKKFGSMKLFVYPDKNLNPFKYQYYGTLRTSKIYYKCLDNNCQGKGVFYKTNRTFEVTTPHTLEFIEHSYAQKKNGIGLYEGRRRRRKLKNVDDNNNDNNNEYNNSIIDNDNNGFKIENYD